MRVLSAQGRRQRWSARVLGGGALVLLAAVAAPIWMMRNASVWQRLEVATLLLSVVMFAFLFWALYFGIRLDARERLHVRWAHWSETRLKEDWSTIDIGSSFTETLGSDSIGGFIVGILLDILVSLALAFAISVVLWLGVNAMIAVILITVLPGFYLFRRSLRVVLAQGRHCRGRVWRAGFFALRTTVLYTIWLHAIFLVASQVSKGADRLLL